MKDWVEIEIKKLGKVVTGKTPPTSDRTYFDGNYHFVSPKDLDFDATYIKETITTVTEKAIQKFKNQVLPKNSVMFTSLSYGFGKMGITSSVSLTNQQINSIIVDDDNHDFRFVYYLLRFNKQRIFAYNAGIVTPIIPKSVFEKIKVHIPNNIQTQRKIASILSAYDDLIENNLKRIKLLEEKAFLRYKQIVREEKFSQKAFNEVADYINGFPFKPDDWKSEGLPIIKIKELKSGVQNDTPRNDGENIPEKYFIENKDILFAWSASIGVYLWRSGKSILNQHIFNVKSFDKDLHNWLYFSLLEKIPDFINLSNGATMQHIKKSALGMVHLPVPPKKVYEEFQKETDPILNLVVNLNQQNTKLREARDILLPRLMSGEIAV